MARNETFDIAGPAGALEAVLMHPEGEPRAAAVVCHAHPLHGGMMHFKVVFRAAKALQVTGVAALRFNFRGVGHSEGVHDAGVGEQDDVRAVLTEAARRYPVLPLILGGFSFGSAMALRVASTDRRVEAAFALGLPLSMMADISSFVDGRPLPRLFVQGEQDSFGPAERLREVVATLPEPKSMVVVPQADHFFAGHLDEMQQAVSDWAGERPWERRP